MANTPLHVSVLIFDRPGQFRCFSTVLVLVSHAGTFLLLVIEFRLYEEKLFIGIYSYFKDT